MWHRTFDTRLAAWNQLRNQSLVQPVPQALAMINAWWFQTPWIPYHLHWDDRHTWPDPWQLLDDNLFCSLARGLGIMYTIAMLDRPDLQDALLIETDSDNLVLIDRGKYILNWDSTTIVNISPQGMKSRHSVTLEQIKQQLR
mgnify:CR=1 FL=1